MEIIVEVQAEQARLTELGVAGWPMWKDAEGTRELTLDAAERSYFLAGRATLTPEGGAPVTVAKGDLIYLPAGRCRWEVHETVRRHYRSEALSPACCII